MQLEGAHGPLSAAQSKAILERLRQKNGDPSILERHVAVEEAAVNSPLVVGNKATLLQDGAATYKAMFAAIRKARHHVNVETYIIEDDEVGRDFTDLLIATRKKGVRVNVIYDSVGSLNTPKEFFDRLRDNGIPVLEFNPVNPLSGDKDWSLNNRDHRKLLIVDGRVAFLGGINISNVYSGGSAPSGKKIARRKTGKRQGGAALARHACPDRRSGGRRVPEVVHADLGEAGWGAAGRCRLSSRNSKYGARKSCVLSAAHPTKPTAGST